MNFLSVFVFLMAVVTAWGQYASALDPLCAVRILLMRPCVMPSKIHYKRDARPPIWAHLQGRDDSRDALGEHFHRSVKWSEMGPTGGSLVSGRGGFRPGFLPRSWRDAIVEPNFVKRSAVFYY